MIIADIKGGLGNQLFQYAAGYSLALHHNTPFKAVMADFLKPDTITGSKRTYDLDKFIDPPSVITPAELAHFTKRPWWTKCSELFDAMHKRRIYKERSTLYDPNFFNTPDNVYLKGNRQSELYFKPYKQQVIDKLIVKPVLVNHLSHFTASMKQEESVAVHIRRGDYLSAVAMKVLGIIPISYYQNAFTKLINLRPITKVFVFSDDIEWVRKNLHFDISTVYISDVITQSSIEDFYLMTQCSHQIIANSTFSWWAAYLNKNPHKIVIAPKPWFSNPNFKDKDLIPKEWLTLDIA